MVINKNIKSQVVSQSKEVLAKYFELVTLHAPMAINTEKLRQVVQDLTNFQIKDQILPESEMGDLRGVFLLEKEEEGLERAIILISAKNNTCWKRFTFVKELSHLFLDINDLEGNNNAQTQAECLIYADRDKSNVNLLREQCGVIAAIELLIPEYTKENILHMYNVKEYSLYKLASMYQVPERFIEYRVREWTA